MKKFLMVLAILIFIGGCAARQVVKVPDAVQKIDARENQKNCVEADYKGDKKVILRVMCPGRLIHVVTKLKPDTNYAVLIGNNPIVIIKSSSDGIIVFGNQFGEDVEIIQEINEQEIKPNAPAHEAMANKPAYASNASADKGGE